MRYVRSLCAFVILATLATAAFAVRVVGPLQCQGDCDLNGRVSIYDLVTAVRVALGDADVTACPGSDTATIDALVRAVVAALDGCPRGSTFDVHDFTDFAFQRQNGLGDCWPVDTLYSPTLSR